jgi:hypothetical protein
MLLNKNFLKNPNASKIIFASSILVLCYWIIGTSFNVYSIAIVGAIFELTAIPMLCLLVILPILSILLIVRKGITIKSLSFYSLMILLINVLLLVFKK